MNLLIIILSIMFVAGCATNSKYSNPTYTQLHEFHPYSTIQYLSCDGVSYFPGKEACSDGYKAGLEENQSCDASISFIPDEAKMKIAKESYIYALLSNNVYRDSKSKPIFEILSLPEPVRYESDNGLAIEEYRIIENGKLAEIIVVFEGTTFSSLEDWKANLSIYYEPKQYSQAKNHVEGLVKEAKEKGVRLTATGHSLGGGIALNMSYHFEGVDAYVFNTSPRAFFDAKEIPSNKRVSIGESGEILGAGRWLWHEKLSDFPSYTYNFMKWKKGLTRGVNEHSIYYLSRGLLLYAASEGERRAAEIFENNILKSNYPLLLGGSVNKDHDIEMCRELVKKHT